MGGFRECMFTGPLLEVAARSKRLEYAGAHARVPIAGRPVHACGEDWRRLTDVLVARSVSFSAAQFLGGLQLWSMVLFTV
jgi:hypothetical protein